MVQPKQPHVLIVGAGLGGLALAQALRKQGISYQIFERSNIGQAQGFALGLHSILDQLAEAFPSDMPPIKVTDHFLPLSMPAQAIFYPPGLPTARMGVQDTGEGSIIRCNRGRLRSWLATNIDVAYGKVAVSIEQAPGSVTVHFRDGSSATGDALIGADGAHSVVRQSLLAQLGREDPIRTLPLEMLVGEVTLAGADFASQLELGYSCYWAGFASSGSIFVGLNSVSEDGKKGHYYWGVVYPDEAATQRPHWTTTSSKEEILSVAKEKIAHIHPRFCEIVEKTSPEGILSPSLTFANVELEHLPATRVTLLGDAAHCMAPFRGEGGVHAMRDALELSRTIGTIAKQGKSHDPKAWEHELGKYQIEMLERGNKAVRLSRAAGDEATASQAPRVGWAKQATNIPPVSITLDEIPRSNVTKIEA